MKHKGTALLCAACLAFTGAAAAMPAPTAVYAEDLVYNGMKYTVSDNRVTITGFTRDIPAELVIPEKIDGMQVFMIGNQAFKECTKLKKFQFSQV